MEMERLFCLGHECACNQHMGRATIRCRARRFWRSWASGREDGELVRSSNNKPQQARLAVRRSGEARQTSAASHSLARERVCVKEDGSPTDHHLS